MHTHEHTKESDQLVSTYTLSVVLNFLFGKLDTVKAALCQREREREREKAGRERKRCGRVGVGAGKSDRWGERASRIHTQLESVSAL